MRSLPFGCLLSLSLNRLQLRAQHTRGSTHSLLLPPALPKRARFFSSTQPPPTPTPSTLLDASDDNSIIIVGLSYDYAAYDRCTATPISVSITPIVHAQTNTCTICVQTLSKCTFVARIKRSGQNNHAPKLRSLFCTHLNDKIVYVFALSHTYNPASKGTSSLGLRKRKVLQKLLETNLLP